MSTEAKYADYLRKCIRCSFCQPVCPLFAVLRDERVLPRAKVRLAIEFLTGRLQATPRLKELFSLCLECRACESVCPASVPTNKIVQEMRNKLQNVSSPDKKIYGLAGLILTRPRLVRRLASIFSFSSKGLEKAGIIKLTKKLVPLAEQAGAILPPLVHKTFINSRKRPDLRQVPSPGPQKTVAYFVSCATNYFFPETANAVLKVLGKNGFTVLTPTETICCGVPLLSGGEHQAARELAQQVINQYNTLNTDIIVTDCAGCGLHMKEFANLWPDLPGAKAFSAKIQDINSFMVAENLKAGSTPVTQKVTYHDPCHLGRAQGVYAEPRKVLTQIKGLELIEMEESDRCCGGSGFFCITHPHLSSQVLARKLDNIEKTGTGLVATSCPACRIQLERGIKSQIVKRVVHPVELFARTWDEEAK